MNLIKIIKKNLPFSLLLALKKIRKKKLWEKYKQLSSKEIFTKIYEENVWGSNGSKPGSYYSGGGSHDAALIEPYTIAVNKFLSRFPNKPDVLDIGCGDFNVGSKIRSLCNKYIACDIVDSLIEQDQLNFKDLNVEFKVYDLISEKCEETDVIFLRQVLQHLSNDDIEKGLKNIIPNCQYLVLTEHLPPNTNFKKNINKTTGPDVRAELNSGIDITEAPFSYNLKSECICEVPDQLGTLKTIVYTCKYKNETC
ncbi:MAG: class I SAM-dependent methyltransferase [Ginsengibacter sp.]